LSHDEAARIMTAMGALPASGVASYRVRQRWSLILLAVFFVTGPVRAAQPSLAVSLHKLGFAEADVGYILFDVASQRVLGEQNADQLFLPASVSKLATAYAALAILGPDYRFSTLLYRRGTDVYLKGGGDPSLANTDLGALAQQLRGAIGATAAPLRFFYDDSLTVNLAQISLRQPIAVAYNTGISALDVDFNRVEVDWQRRAGGGLDLRALSIADGMILPADWIPFTPAPLETLPEMPFLYAGDGGLDRWDYAALGDQGSTFLPVKATSAHTALLFQSLAKSAGVALASPQRGQVPPDARAIGRVDSQPLAQILVGLLRYSNNPSAELIGLAASRRLTGRSLDLGPSAAALTSWIEQRAPKANWQGFYLANHSGLTPDSRVTPRQMARLLSLIAEDGTLIPEMPALTDEGRATIADNARGLTGKSGTMDYARGLAGYFLAKDGRRLGFAIFVFDRARRAVLDAEMDPRIPNSTPEALDWVHRALLADQLLLGRWMKSY
jgi:D-alanyl-D-alanine carboxypeptidase/D-alanyl-D-alanine-endopeptidase (penicillin-binding protein 4)